MNIAGTHSTPARIAGPHTTAWRRLGRRLAVGSIALVGASHGFTITHNSLVYFCELSGLVHAVCQDEVRGGSLIAGLDKDCRLTRETVGGGVPFAVAENRQRVSAANDSSEITNFNIPIAANSRWCTINRGKYLQWSVLGPVRIVLQPESQACATYNGGGLPLF